MAAGDEQTPRFPGEDDAQHRELTAKYPITAQRLIDLGLYEGPTATPSERLGEVGVAADQEPSSPGAAPGFTIPGFEGVKTLDDFKRNPAAQRAAIRTHIDDIDSQLEDAGLHENEGQTVNGVRITRNGLRALVHKYGPEGARMALGGEPGEEGQPEGEQQQPPPPNAIETAKGFRGSETQPPNAWAELFQYLSPDARRKLLSNARVAGRAQVQEMVKDALDYFERSGGADLKPDPQGRTLVDYVRASMLPNQQQRILQSLAAKQLSARATADLNDLSDREMQARISALIPENPNAPEWIRKAHPWMMSAARKAVEQKVADIKAWRLANPADAAEGGTRKLQAGTRLSINDNGEASIDQDADWDYRVKPAREIKRFQESLKNKMYQGVSAAPSEDGGVDIVGNADDSKARWRAVEARIGARLDAQKRWGVPELNRRAITTAEAQALFQGVDLKSLGDQDWTALLGQAQQRALLMFGPRYADRALRDAANLIVRQQRGRDAANDILAGSLNGTFSLDDLMGGRRMQPWGEQQRNNAIPGAGSRPVPTEGGQQETMQIPSPGHVDWLRKNDSPQARSLFDKKFGPGQSRKHIGSEAGPEPDLPGLFGGTSGTPAPPQRVPNPRQPPPAPGPKLPE